MTATPTYENEATPTRHLLDRAVVIEDARLVYVPVPKSACTSIMWALSSIAGIRRERFLRSPSIQPTPELTIHDMEVWGPEHRLGGRDDAEIKEILTSDDWFQFSAVRSPANRLWSAWQSKILGAEPQMVSLYSGRAWFPHDVGDIGGVIESYRSFVGVLGQATIDGEMPTLDDSVANPHWLPQTWLLGDLGLKSLRIGHLEDLTGLLASVSTHLLEQGFERLEPRRANSSSIPFDPAVNTEDEIGIINRLYRADFEILGYEPPAVWADAPDPAWLEGAAPALDLIRQSRPQNERILALYDFGRAVNKQNEKIETTVASARRSRDQARVNLESARTQVERLRQNLTSAQTRADTLERKYEALTTKMEKLSLERDTLRRDLSVSRIRATAARAAAGALESRVKEMEHSTSWRWTRPLRAVSRRLSALASSSRRAKVAEVLLETAKNPKGQK